MGKVTETSRLSQTWRKDEVRRSAGRRYIGGREKRGKESGETSSPDRSARRKKKTELSDLPGGSNIAGGQKKRAERGKKNRQDLIADARRAQMVRFGIGERREAIDRGLFREFHIPVIEGQHQGV